MVLKYGIPPGNPTVVWDDVEGVPGSATNDPYVSWQYHLGRTGGLRGGVDMTARWVPVYAPIDCRVEHYSGGAGTAVRMWAADGSGWSDVFDHLSAISVPNNAVVPYGGRVGTSGDTGAAGAPHLHWHRLDPSGNRRNPWDYFTDGTTNPGGDMAISYPTRNDYRGDFTLAINQATQLKNANGTDANIAATPDVGRLFVTGHVYAQAASGQALDIWFILSDVSTGAESPHFVERVVAGPDGRIFANPTFQLGLASTRRVFLRIQAPSSNTATVKITRLAADATLFQ
jgi:hypothetical protein